MAGKMHKLTKNGQTIYPATTTDAVVHPDLAVSSSKLIEEVNVSKIFPTGGIDGTNKYTLETAIAMIPASLRNVGIKCSFLNEAVTVEEWVYQGGTFTSADSWMQGGSGAGGNLILKWNTDVATTRKQVKKNQRKAGLQISYNSPNSGWINEQFIGISTDDAEWIKDSNWEKMQNEKNLDAVKKETVKYGDLFNYTPLIRILRNYVMQSDGMIRAAGASIACISTNGARLLKFSKGLPASFISNSVGYTIFREDGTFETGNYNLNENVEIELPEKSISIGVYVLQNVSEEDLDFRLYSLGSQENTEGIYLSSSIKIETSGVVGYYDRVTGDFNNAYTNLVTVEIALDEESKHISFPIFSCEFGNTVNQNLKASNVTFFNGEGGIIKNLFYAYCDSGILLHCDVPADATKCAVSYFNDDYCNQNGLKTLAELGGIKVLADKDVKELDDEILKAKAALGLSDIPRNLIDNHYSPLLICKKYCNTDTAKIKYDSEYFDYPVLISNGQHNTNLTIYFESLIPNLEASEIGYICAEMYCHSAANGVQFGVIYPDNSFYFYKVDLVEGYNRIKLRTKEIQDSGKIIKRLLVNSTSNTDEIGRVYVGKNEPIDNFFGCKDYQNHRTGQMSNTIKDSIDNHFLFYNLTSIEEVALKNGLDNLNELSLQYLTILPKRFDNKRYGIVVKTTGQASQFIVNSNYGQNTIDLIKSTLNGDAEDATVSPFYRETSLISEGNYLTTSAILFEISESYLNEFQITNQLYSLSNKTNITDIRVFAVPDFIQRPSDLVEMMEPDRLVGYASNSLSSIYSTSTGAFREKKMTGLGDSIMAQATYLPMILRKTGMMLRKKIAAGGAHVRPNGDGNCIFFFADNVPEDSDFILVIAGQNDTGQIGNEDYMGTIDDEPYLGEEDKDGACTFASAYKGMLVKLILKCPKAKIVCCGLLPTWTLTAAGMEQYTKNKLILNDFIRDICGLYGIQFVDLIRNVGINWYNASYMINHDGPGEDGGPNSDMDGQVHPSPLGGERCAEYIVSQII